MPKIFTSAIPQAETSPFLTKLAAFGLTRRLRWSRRMKRSAPSPSSDVYLLGDREGVIDLDAKIAHGAFHLA
jgi:hypothetical protein